MHFTPTFALSAIAFLGMGAGVSAAPSQPQAYTTPSHSAAAPPAQSSSASSGATSGVAPSGSGPAPVIINCPQAQQVCCNPTAGSGATIPGPNGGQSNSGLLSGILGILGGGALNGVGETLDLRSALTCGLSVLGDGPCSQTTVCCANTGSGDQTCKSQSGSNIQITLPVAAGILGVASNLGASTSN